MTKFLLAVLLVYSLALPANALDMEAPEVPKSGSALMPEETASFGSGLWELLQKGIKQVRPDLAEASEICVSVVVCVLVVSLIHAFSGRVKIITEMTGTAAVASLLLRSANSMIQLGGQTVWELSEYGKLLYPVMTAALAAQGGVTSSTALYVGTAIFDTALGSLIARLLVPMVYCFLAVSVANSASGENVLKKIGDLIKNTMSWCLKTMLTVFTTYMGITGVVSGTTDAVALKATKVTISSVVPVVGGILSDTSEAILVSAGLMKNAAGIYGILAILAVFLDPFLRIGSHYLLLKLTAALCGIFGAKPMTGLIEDFSAAMGLLLAMTGAVCLMLLISTVCFMKGVA